MTIFFDSPTAPADDILAPPRPQRLSRVDVERLATMDPTSAVTHGALRSMLGKSTDPDDPARPLIAAMQAVGPVDSSTPGYANPARMSPPPGAAEDRRPLTPADIEWLRQLPVDPAQVSADDVAALAALVVQAASTSDQRLLLRYFEPIWAHHDVAEQQQERRARAQEAQARRGARTRHIEQAAIDALAATIHAEVPELRDHEARNRATDQLRASWSATDADLQGRIDLSSSQDLKPRPMPDFARLGVMAEARERGERRRARAEAADPLAGMPKVGG